MQASSVDRARRSWPWAVDAMAELSDAAEAAADDDDKADVPPAVDVPARSAAAPSSPSSMPVAPTADADAAAVALAFARAVLIACRAGGSGCRSHPPATPAFAPELVLAAEPEGASDTMCSSRSGMGVSMQILMMPLLTSSSLLTRARLASWQGVGM